MIESKMVRLLDDVLTGDAALLELYPADTVLGELLDAHNHTDLSAVARPGHEYDAEIYSTFGVVHHIEPQNILEFSLECDVVLMRNPLDVLTTAQLEELLHSMYESCITVMISSDREIDYPMDDLPDKEITRGSQFIYLWLR